MIFFDVCGYHKKRKHDTADDIEPKAIDWFNNLNNSDLLELIVLRPLRVADVVWSLDAQRDSLAHVIQQLDHIFVNFVFDICPVNLDYL